MVLKFKWEDFKNEVERFQTDGNSVIEKYKSSKTEAELNEFREHKRSWQKDVITFVVSSFEPENRSFANEFKANRGYNLGFKLSIDQNVKNEIQALKEEVSGLEYYLKELFISDAIVRINEIDIVERENLDTQGTLDLIVSKLYDLYSDGNYYSIIRILEGNGVRLNDRGEDRNYCRMLENLGVIDTMSGRTVSARLTLEGKYAIEQARKAEVTDYSKISNSQAELKELIGEVLSEIKTLGNGQEIIYDEFDELRKDMTHLSKKSFGQLLKVKLQDLVAAKALDKALASEIFEKFTEQILL